MHLNLNDIGFRIAFAVEGYLDEKLRDDHKYIKYLARVLTKTGGVASDTFIPVGKCTEDQIGQFTPSARGYEEPL